RDATVTGVQTCALPIFADPVHLPGLVAHRVDRTRPGDRDTVHQPDVVLAGRSVAPQDVGLAIAVEVTDPLHLPARGRIHKVDGKIGRASCRERGGCETD